MIPDSIPIHPSHAPFLRSVFTRAKKRTWVFFPPFLCAFSLPPKRVVRVCEREGSACLLVQHPGGIDLMCLPVPFSRSVLRDLLRDVGAVNGPRPTRVMWVDQEDAARMDGAWTALREKDSEYLFDPSRIWAAEGPGFRDLRKQLRRFERSHDPWFRALSLQDIPGCQALLSHWRRRQGRKHPFLLDWGYTRAALERFNAWSVPDLNGWCVELRGRLVAFALTGPLQGPVAHFFVAKTDPDIPGLSMFLRHRVFGALSDYCLVNDAGDMGLPGLRQFKQKFRPVARLPVFSGELPLGAL